jgi:polyferredoxin
MADNRPTNKNRKWRLWRTARRVNQGIFLIIFLWLIAETAAITGASFDGESTLRMTYPVEIFLNIDPFAGALVLLANKALPAAMLLGLVVLASGFFFGRGFCSWVCPMGTLNHLVGETKSTLKGKQRLRANETRPYQKIKYLVLVVCLGAAFFGSTIGGWLDPLCMATRGIALTVIPFVEWCLAGLIGLARRSDVSPLQSVADGLHSLAGSALLQSGGTIVEGGLLLALVFVAVLAANRFIPRFWCRGLCPLGALLGAAGRFGILTLKKDHDACDGCNKCQLHCQGAASPKPGDPWQRAECDLCMNCLAACDKQHALSLGLAGAKGDEQDAPDIKRRHVVTGAAAGAVLVPALRTGAFGSVEGRPDPDRIRPPGSVSERSFLNRCIRCGQCMKICPSNALHPALDEAGAEGLWTPVLVPRIGYCEPSCTLCTDVCPTGAIRSVTEKEKVGRGAPLVRVGTAFIERGRCLPWAMSTPCIVCEEFCPISPKAIVLEEETVTVDGETKTLKRPYVRPDRCSGCGACEFICPVNDRAAIRVSSVGESRDAENSLLQEMGGANWT